MTKYELKILAVKLFLPLAYIGNFLVSKPIGILILSILLYYFSSSLGLGEPFSFSELILWVDQIPENSKSVIFTSILTISGFLLAFSVGSANQKQQLLSHMRIEASNDIEKFFNDASRNATSVDIYIRLLIETVNYINNGADDDTIDLQLHWIVQETQKILPIRSELEEQAISVHRFQTKYSIIFAASWGVLNKLDKAVNAFSEITDNLWFGIPVLNLDDPEIRERFIRQVNVDNCNKYISAYEKNYSIMNRSIGELRGGMLGSITGINFSFLINILKMHIKDK